MKKPSLTHLDTIINNAFIYSNLAYTYNCLGYYPKTIDICEKAEKFVDHNSPAFYTLLRNWTFALIKDKYFVDAILNIRKAIEINPKDVENWVMWGTIHKINGDFASAKKKFEVAHKLDPKHELANEELKLKGIDIFINNINET